MHRLPRHHAQADPEKILRRVEEAHHSIGNILTEFQEAAVLVDALCHDLPVIGVSQGFSKLTGYEAHEVMGTNCRMMLKGVPEAAISKSSRQNVRDFCHMCQLKCLKDISETTAMQPNSRRDGSFFMNLFLLGLVVVHGHPYILSIQMDMGDGLFVRLRQEHMSEAKEKARTIFRHIRSTILHRCGADSTRELDDPTHLLGKEEAPDFGFFSQRLQDHCVLINDGYTAIRREADEVASSCLVFGDRPVGKDSQGLSFRVRVDSVTDKFVGFPILGFTRRRPGDEKNLYPVVSKCLGASVLLGACGEAFARDHHEHFNIGFQLPPKEEIQTWLLQADLPPQRRVPPVPLKSGDVLLCTYTWSGHIGLQVNGNQVMEFDTGRPIEFDVDYYAVVDVCLAAYSVTLLPKHPHTDCSTRAEDEDELDESRGFHRDFSDATTDSSLSLHDMHGLASGQQCFSRVKLNLVEMHSSPGVVDILLKDDAVNHRMEETGPEDCSHGVPKKPVRPDRPLGHHRHDFSAQAIAVEASELESNNRNAAVTRSMPSRPAPQSHKVEGPVPQSSLDWSGKRLWMSWGTAVLLISGAGMVIARKAFSRGSLVTD